MPQIELPKAKIAESCRQRHIRKLALYGSVLRDELAWTLVREVDLLGRDVIARSDNSTRRQAILESAETIHAAA